MTLKQFCLRGHNINEVGRYADRRCRACKRASSQARKARNRDAVRARSRAYAKAYRAVGPLRGGDALAQEVHAAMKGRLTGYSRSNL